nr:hypothetical protein [Luteimonas granuli]
MNSAVRSCGVRDEVAVGLEVVDVVEVVEAAEVGAAGARGAGPAGQHEVRRTRGAVAVEYDAVGNGDVARHHVAAGEDTAGTTDAVLAGIELVGLAGIDAVGGADRILLVIAGPKHQPAPVADGAEDRVVTLAVGIPARGDAVIGAGLQALEILAQDEVDHATDGIGTVDGGRTVLEDLHPFDQCHRDGVDVDRAIGVGDGADPALAVDQHQRAVHAQATQVDRCRACAAAVVHLGVGRRARDGGGALQEVADGDRAGRLDVLPADDEDRAGGLHVGTLDASAGDFDPFEGRGRLFLRLLRGGGSRRQGDGKGGKRQQDGTGNAAGRVLDHG